MRGLAAVYNVPLGGALFTAEVFYGSFALPVVLPRARYLDHRDVYRVDLPSPRCDLFGYSGVSLLGLAHGVVTAGPASSLAYSRFFTCG